MLLYRILAAIFLFCVSAIWAASYAQVTAATYFLAAIIEKDILDVKAVTLSTPLLAAVLSPSSVRLTSTATDTDCQNVPKEMESLGVALNATTLAFAGVKPKNDSSAENQLLDAYTVVKSLLRTWSTNPHCK